MEIINLSKAELIGQGRDRNCYRHPSIHNQCIKVSRKSQKQTRREQAYFAYLMKRSADTSKLSHYLSTVQTTHGEGATFELILDDKGQISSTLTAVIRDTEVPYSTIRALLDDLRSYLLTQKICVRDLSPNNIMCQQQDGKLNLFIVDGVSNPGINPLNIRVAFMSRYFIKRSWRSLERKVDGLYQELSRHHTDRYKCSPDIEA
ncbi:MAG: YrbL family protein [Thalassolituus sp.]|jgi:hypothetical protein